MAAKTAARKAPAAQANPLLSVEPAGEVASVVNDDKPKKPPTPKGFEFIPSTGGTPIVFPLNVTPDKKWLWESEHEEWPGITFTWMDRAGVPIDMQRRAVELSDTEYIKLITEWFRALGGRATPGE